MLIFNDISNHDFFAAAHPTLQRRECPREVPNAFSESPSKPKPPNFTQQESVFEVARYIYDIQGQILAQTSHFREEAALIWRVLTTASLIKAQQCLTNPSLRGQECFPSVRPVGLVLTVVHNV
jgi:hypothetical protein